MQGFPHVRGRLKRLRQGTIQRRRDAVFVIALELEQPCERIEVRMGINDMMMILAKKDQVAEPIPFA